MSEINNSLSALSPLDGRYLDKLVALHPIFSEMGLIRYRTLVEVKWLLHLSQLDTFTALPQLDPKTKTALEDLITQFDLEDAEKVKAYEKECNHDVKSVEYFLREKCQGLLGNAVGFFHFACTSEDINNLAYALMTQTAKDTVLIPALEQLLSTIESFAKQYAHIPMLCRTHGQPATPSTIGKEFANFAYRIRRPLSFLKQLKLTGKFNGATGNYNAHHAAHPEIDWPTSNQTFVESLGLEFNPFTTQIEPHDRLAEQCDLIKQINCILLDLAQDCWQYIGMSYLKLAQIKKEVGSSTMPHKVNPIHFENAEGNLGLANSLLSHFSDKLTRSRLQRDLSDSTVLRNIGSAYGYSLLACQSLLRGLKQITPHEEHMRQDLEQHWEILAEPIQIIMRQHGIDNAYELLKDFSRGQAVTQTSLQDFIDSLTALPEEVRTELKALTPEKYTGLAQQLVEKYL